MHKAFRSPSEILNDTVVLVSSIIVSDITKAISLSPILENNEDQLPSLDTEHLSFSQSLSSAVLEQLWKSQDDVSITPFPSLHPMDRDNDEHTCLVPLLVIWLLWQLKKQQFLSGDVFDMSSRLIEKVVYEFGTASDIPKNETSAHIKIHKVCRAIYDNLPKEFGTKIAISLWSLRRLWSHH